ncbi:MAG TPA: SdrD B-like domain-containing protein, partial [Gemmatales bacterium]|nr:SdrD B-like domain-containing protein [Gemmatales bacterium]
PAVVPVNFFLTPGSTRTQNFGYQEKQATINGIVFNDANGSGSLDGGEVGIANVTVRLLGAGIDGIFGTADDLPTITQQTDANGNYNLTPLTAGTYRVEVDSASPVLNNFFLTTNNATQTIVLTSGSAVVTSADPVGYRLDPFSNFISGLVFNDVNGNGLFDGTDTGFPGVNVQLRWAGRNGILGDSDDQIFNAVTGVGGAYTATGLPVGDFYLVPTSGVPAGFALTAPAVIPSKITLGFGEDYPGFNGGLSFFGYQPANSSISGVIWDDLNGDNILDPGELGRFGGTRVYIDTNNNGIYDIGEPNAISSVGTGEYTISNLAANPNGYRVRVDLLTSPIALPSGYVLTTPQPQIVVVGPSQAVTGVNMGAQLQNATITGRVFIDLNGNNIFDPGEVGAANQTVTLNTGQSFITGPDGIFTFTGLAAGTYVVTTTVPTGGTVGSPGNPQTVVLGAGSGASLNFPVQFQGGQTSGVWYFTFAGVNTVLTNSDGSQLVVSDTDIVRLTADGSGSYRYSVFFRGSNFGLSSGGNEGIDAFTFTNTGQIIISTRGTHSVNATYSAPGVGSGTAITGFGEDLIRFTPSPLSLGSDTIQAGTWSRFFRGSRVGLSGSAENVNAVSIVYNAAGTAIDRILL